MLTVLVSTISNSQVCEAIFNQSFNDTLTNDIVSFEQLGPGKYGIAPEEAVFNHILIFFFFLHENICYGYSLEVPLWGTSNEYL